MTHFYAMLPMLLAMGAAGMLHCAGMCGGLVLLATGARRQGRAAAVVLYLLGKAWSYALLGAAAGVAGQTIARTAPAGWGSRSLAIVSGGLLLFLGLQFMGVLKETTAGFGWLRPLSDSIAHLARESGWLGKLMLGVANGFLPCPMVYGFVGMAAMTGSMAGGAASMIVLGLTSSVPLVLCAWGGYRLGGLAGRRLPLAGGLLALLVGVMVLYRGFALSGAAHHMHH